MRFEPRKYQADCVDAWIKSLKPGSNPVIAVPTGGGKSVILGEFLTRLFDIYPDYNVLVLSHTKEIVQQDYDALLEYFPSFGVGIYQAAIGRRDVRKVTVAGIQSVYRVPELFEDIDIAIVDEAHTVNHKHSGMYRTLFGHIGCTVAGMSATVFRTGYGYIYEGKSSIFNTLAYDLTSIKNFNKLIEDGYLTKLISVAPELELDSSKVKKSAGDYNLKDLAETHDKYEITKQAIKETIYYGKNSKKWLIFAIDTDHATNIYNELIENGIEADELHSKMKKDRDEVVDDFKNGSTKALVSVGMVTTGFDSPNVDLIVLLRPTTSPVLHVQMVGRGLRVAEGKPHCLVLDFAGNTNRLGPVNNVKVPKKNKKKGESGLPPTKKCPVCRVITYTMAKVCEVCGHEFKFQTSLTATASTEDIIQKDTKAELNVKGVSYSIHSKPGKPDSLKVTYVCGVTTISEWVCLDHKGYPKHKADNWVRVRTGRKQSLTTSEAYYMRESFKVPKKILVDMKGKYPSIIDVLF